MEQFTIGEIGIGEVSDRAHYRAAQSEAGMRFHYVIGLLGCIAVSAIRVEAQGTSATRHERVLEDSVRVLNAQLDSLRQQVRDIKSTAGPAQQGRSVTRRIGAFGDPVVFSSGKWEVSRAVDKMTDKAECTGVYDGRKAVQLSDHALYISLRGRGGVQGITSRFGDAPADEVRLPTDLEKQLDIVAFDNADFDRLKGVSRLRVQVLTVLDQLVVEDIDLTGMVAAADFMANNKDCR